MTNFNTPAAEPNLVGLWDFRSGATRHDTGLADGIAQDGHTHGNASISSDQLHLDGTSDYFDVSGPDTPFDLKQGTVEVQFTQAHHVGTSPDTLVNRGEQCDAHREGFFEIRVTASGKVEAVHIMPDGVSSTLSTAAGFFSEGDVVNVVYSFNAATGATLTVQNLTAGTSTTVETLQTGLTFDIGDNDDENFTFGAREYDDGRYDRFFDGSIDYVAIYNTDDVPGLGANAPDYIVEGTPGHDLIDAAYSGDPEGDRVDNLDNDLTPPNNDDVIKAGDGKDTVYAGDGDDTVYGGSGNDFILGDDNNHQDGDDLLFGEEGDDTLCGLAGNDTLVGGTGNDLLEGMLGDDLLLAGDGNDVATGDEGNDTIFGNAGNDTLDGGKGADLVYGGDGGDSILGGDGDDTLFGDNPAAGTVISGNLIFNGSFEITSGMRTTSFGFESDGAAPGWTDVNGQEINFHNDGRGGVTPTDGQNWLDLEGSPGNLRVGQDVYGIEDGETYRLTFDAADKADEPQSGPDENLIKVYWGGELIATIDPAAGTMTEYTFDLIGGAGDGSNRLEFAGTGALDKFGASVDDVRLVHIAGEPGEGGNDIIDGGTGNDLIEGQQGADTITGGDGDDTIIAGAGDSVIGGEGSDSIFVNAAELDGAGDKTAAIHVDGSTEGSDNDTLDLTDFVAHRNLVETVDADGDSTSGTVEVQNADGDWVPVIFAEIETLLLPPVAPDGIVDGEEFGELMTPGYDDSNPPTDGGGDQIDGDDGDDDSIRGNGGDDTIDAGAGNDTVDGGTGDDIINGGTGDDIVMGGDGNDLVSGGLGNDTVMGNDGDDTLRGNAGDDLILGGDGNDSMGGGAGNDTLEGGAGNDEMDGGSGDDLLDGGAGNDTLQGSSGNDTIIDMEGDNLVISGPDDPFFGNPDLGFPTPGLGGPQPGIDPNPNDDRDSVITGAGNDTIITGDDDDTIDAGDGDNVIDAGYDRDLITSGSGNDLIIGGEGNDTIYSGGGDDTIYGGINNDQVNLIDDNVNPAFNDDILDNGDDLIYAGDGNDLVFGEDDNDTIHGGAGNDTLDGGIDDDVIFGGEGDDLIIGGQGADSLDGGLGNDTFTVGTFTDPIYGDDYVEGLGDTIIGGEDPDGNDVDVLDLNGSRFFDILFEDSIDPTGTSGESGRVIYYTDDTKATVKGELVFKEIENVIPCFTPGAMIATPRGEVPVETLREGDKVITRDNGIREIRWTGSRTLNRQELAEGFNLKPILIRKGALGHNLPERDMLVSPQHRVLVTGESPQLYFEESEVLVAARHLVGKTGISVVDTMRTTYIHFMFDQHEVVLSDGAWTESFQPGDHSLGALGAEIRDEIFALFPELATREGLTDYAAARRSLKAHEARLLQL